MVKELPVDRNLINNQFDSYRLCNNNDDNKRWQIESLSFETIFDQQKLQTIELDQNDYSFVHVSMISSINNLFIDTSSSSTSDRIYFITDQGSIIGVDYLDGKKLKKLFQIPDYDRRHSFASLSFLSEKSTVLICHSKRFDSNHFVTNLLIIQRNFPDEIWTLKTLIPFDYHHDSTDGNQLQQSSHMFLFNTGDSINDTTISIILGSIIKINRDQSQQQTKNEFKSCFVSSLHWLTIDKKQNGIIIHNYHQLIENGLKSDWPKYVAIHNDNLIVISNGRMKFFNRIIDGSVVPESISNELNISDEKEFDAGDLINRNQKSDQHHDDNNLLELEDCDLPDFYDCLIMTVFKNKSGQILNEIDLTSHQWICQIPNNVNNHHRLPFFVIRHDVDAFIYEIDIDDDRFEPKHIGVFDAFGYIQASRMEKRFITMLAAKNNKDAKIELKYAVIAESLQKLSVYWKNNQNQTSSNNGYHSIIQLLNQQHHNDHRKDYIQGLYASSTTTNQSSIIFVLTNNLIWLIKFFLK